MAISQTHFRSISLPSRLHPINPTNLETEIEKLKSLQISAANSEAIQSGLVWLAELYNFVHKSVVLEHHQDEKSMQESLSNSVELLDSCNTIREMVQMMRENVQALQSALRRKGLDSSIKNDIAKSLKTLKNLENKNGSNISVSGDENFIRVLREVSGLTTAIFKCTLVFFSSSTIKSSGWNLVSRLVLNKSVASSKDHHVITEMGCVDFALSTLRNGDSKVVDKQLMVQRSLQNLESCMEGIEAGLERLFRQLLQSRVTLLNILTDH